MTNNLTTLCDAVGTIPFPQWPQPTSNHAHVIPLLQQLSEAKGVDYIEDEHTFVLRLLMMGPVGLQQLLAISGKIHRVGALVITPVAANTLTGKPIPTSGPECPPCLRRFLFYNECYFPTEQIGADMKAMFLAHELGHVLSPEPLRTAETLRVQETIAYGVQWLVAGVNWQFAPDVVMSHCVSGMTTYKVRPEDIQEHAQLIGDIAGEIIEWTHQADTAKTTHGLSS